jgi:hypothetical protein
MAHYREHDQTDPLLMRLPDSRRLSLQAAERAQHLASVRELGRRRCWPRRLRHRECEA